MHAWLAFVVGILVVTAAFLFFAAFSGISYIGLAVQVEVTFALAAVVVALIVTLIFYFGVKAQFKQVKTGKEALIGAVGTAATDVKPKGEVRVMGEFWEAKAKDAPIGAGTSVKVVGMDGMILVVEALEQKV